uniref:CARD domain-containing protein n=1 Tax=Plectus sambesii TaxID=2011161 RepID=A0A914X0Z7_9BILA
MDELKQIAIEDHYADLMKSMDPLFVMDNLRTGLLSMMEKESIKESSSTRRDRSRELISILFRKREDLKPFEALVEALKKTDANHEVMAKDILKTYKHDNGATLFTKVSRNSLSDAGDIEYGLKK